MRFETRNRNTGDTEINKIKNLGTSIYVETESGAVTAKTFIKELKATYRHFKSAYYNMMPGYQNAVSGWLEEKMETARWDLNNFKKALKQFRKQESFTNA